MLVRARTPLVSNFLQFDFHSQNGFLYNGVTIQNGKLRVA